MQADTRDQATVAALVQLATTAAEDWEAALQQILRIDAQILGVERVGYWSLREDPPSIFCELSYLRTERSFERGSSLLAVDFPRYFGELTTTDILATSDARRDPATSELIAYLKAHDITAMIDIPVKIRGKLAGVLCHEHVGPPRVWEPSDLQLALAVGQSVVAALEQRARTRAEEGERRASFLAKVSWVLAQTRDPHEVANRAVEAAVPTLGDAVMLDLVEGATIRTVAIHSRSTDESARVRELVDRYPPTLGSPQFVTQVIQLQQSLLVPRVASDVSRYAVDRGQLEMFRALGFRSLMGVPLVCRERVLGAMVFASAQPFGQDELRLAESCACRVAAALENARLFTEREVAIRARDEFITLASHELLNPLGSLMLAAQALTRRVAGSSDSVARASRVIARQARALERLATRMIDSCEIGQGQLSVEARSVDLVPLARRVVDCATENLGWTNGTVILDAPESARVRGDERRLEDLIGDLVDNAKRFGRGQRVDVAVRANGDKVLLSVRDRGPGIAPERRAEIFDRFQRGGLSTRQYGGLGLGLYVARGVVEAHDGTIRVEGPEGGGAMFVVELPLLKEPPSLPR